MKQPIQNVTITYVATLEDEAKIDSVHKLDKPLEFAVGAGKVLKGMDEAITYVSLDSTVHLYPPYEHAFGERGVPSYSDYLFEINILKID